MTSSSDWLYAGPSSSIPDLSTSTSPTSDTKFLSADSSTPPPCLILSLAASPPAALKPSAASLTIASEPQLLVFRYRSKIHAIDHSCPHQSFPLSDGSIYDIEDFGIVLSAGIACPKHGWTFDLFTGESDRGGYKLGVWDVEVRGEEVWVRRRPKKKRIGRGG
ncbi:unnamed protein product [Zymoseptoria tritici ST99CH_1A5]|uniref:Rieske domain-containing protein n=1 Tax=Zymoseptoria tritici ST99CH_1A5 TaxID=1276529 RepID=A0A1Y6LKW5_ZYMTR|nr:unnamed protein product [Zymoseptoria tritici ST99CH_1A5]